MKNIVLACAAGLSTSLMVARMQEAARNMGYECSIQALPVDDVLGSGLDADIILLGPQVRFQVKKFQKEYACPVEAIEMTAYGAMDGARVMKHVVEVLGA